MDNQITDNFHKAIGRFAVNFEHVCMNMNVICTFLLSRSGIKDQQISQILLADHSAERTRTLLASLYSQIMKPDKKSSRIVDALLKDVKTLTEKRNKLMHQSWFIGYSENPENIPEEARAFKARKNKQGVTIERLNFSVKDFDSLSVEAERLKELIMYLVLPVNYGEDLSSTLSVKGNKIVVIKKRIKCD